MKKLVTNVLVVSAVMTAPFIPYSTEYVQAATAEVQGENALTGININPQWVDQNTILVTNENEETVTYLVDVRTKKVLNKFQGEVVVSPDGKKLAYLSSNPEDPELDGILTVMDLATKEAKQIGTDNEVKNELTWSKDSSKVFFIYKADATIIGSIDLAAGTFTKLYEDALKYKSGLSLAPDEKSFIYTVSKEAKTTTSTNADGETDVDSIDTAGTEPQINMASSGAKQSTILTTDLSNKLFASYATDDRIVYVTANPDDEAAAPTLKVFTPGSGEKVLLQNANIVFATTFKGFSYAVVEEKDGSYSINRIGTLTGTVKKLATVKEQITGLTFSPWTGEMLVSVPTEEGDKVALLSQGKLIDITK